MFAAYVIKEVTGLKIAILGLLDDQFNPTLREIDPNLTILDPITTLKDLTRKLRESSDLIVVLSQLGESKDKKLARENHQIDLILGGGGDALKAVTERVNEVPIYRLEPRGGYLGRLDYLLAWIRKDPSNFSSRGSGMNWRGNWKG